MNDKQKLEREAQTLSVFTRLHGLSTFCKVTKPEVLEDCIYSAHRLKQFSMMHCYILPENVKTLQAYMVCYTHISKSEICRYSMNVPVLYLKITRVGNSDMYPGMPGSLLQYDFLV